MLLMAQTVAPETGGRGVRRTFTTLEPCHCKADSSELLTRGQEFTEKRSNDAVDCVMFERAIRKMYVFLCNKKKG